MNDDVWRSIVKKAIGMYEAIDSLPADCQKCGNLVEPVDFGVDPFNNERLWVTKCCGVMEKYYEKVTATQLP